MSNKFPTCVLLVKDEPFYSFLKIASKIKHHHDTHESILKFREVVSFKTVQFTEN